MRFLLLALSLFLPSFLAADSIDYASAGSLAQHTAIVAGSVAAGHTWSVTDELVDVNDTTTGKDTQGQLGKVDITSGTLFKCATGLCFNGGTVDITGNTGTNLLTESFISGTITTSGGNTFLNANLPNGGTVEIESAKGVFSSNTVVTSAGVTPEPPALLLLGTGLVGLWWLGRSKLIDTGRRHALDEATGKVSAE